MTTGPRPQKQNNRQGTGALSLPRPRWKLLATPLASPRADRSLAQQDHLQRSMSVLRHSVLRFEYWLSPNGLLREWCRCCLLLAVFIAIPLLCFSPLVSVFLEHLNAWSTALLEICSNLAQIPGRLSAGVLFVLTGGLLLRWLLRH